MEVRNPFDEMTGRTDDLLAEVSGVFLTCEVNVTGSVHSPRLHLISLLSLSPATGELVFSEKIKYY